MPLFAFLFSLRYVLAITILSAFSLIFSAFRPTQITLNYRLLNGYFLSNEIPVEKSKPTLFVFEQAATFEQAFKPATTMSRKPDTPNFSKEMVIGIALPSTNKSPKLSVSRVFVQDSTLSIRYVRVVGTTSQSYTTQPILLLAIPRSNVVKTRLIENGKVVQTLQKKKSE